MKYAFLNANVLDGLLNEAGDMPVRHGAVLVEDGLFSAVCPDTVPTVEQLEEQGYSVVDLKDSFLMPGLINMHVHLPLFGTPVKVPKKQFNYKGLYSVASKLALARWVFKRLALKNVRAELYGGTTTIRAVGGLFNHDNIIRDGVKEGKFEGPRILSSGTAITVVGGHLAGSLSTEAHSVEECVADVRREIALKPDFIKLMITGGVLDADEEGVPGKLVMPPEYVKAACDEAHAAGLKVAAHVECTEGIRVALENGVDYIEHGAHLDEECIRLFHEKGASVTCTLLTFWYTKCNPDFGWYWDVSAINSSIVTEGVIACAKTALENGIPVGMGTDGGCPGALHYDTWRELELFTENVGVTPAFALHTMTAKNAELLDIASETGSVEVGKSADFVVVKSNPLENFRTIAQPEIVSVFGKPIFNPKVKKHALYEQELDRIIAD